MSNHNFDDTSLSADADPASLEDAVIVSGSSTFFEASTVGEYLRHYWPEVGLWVLHLLEDGLSHIGEKTGKRYHYDLHVGKSLMQY